VILEPAKYPQGLWDFVGFASYLHEWIRPNLLKDLETVFEGACNEWKQDNMPNNGRGDFVLAIALFAVFDHLGAFLAEDEDASLMTRDNISRVAVQLPSTRDVDLIVSHFGRNALVHGAWPQTVMLMEGEKWAFGLNVSADPRPFNEDGEPTHNYLYWRKYPMPWFDCKTRLMDILKLRLNVRNLRHELGEFVTSINPDMVQPAVFQRIRKIAVGSVYIDSATSFLTDRQPRTKRKSTFGSDIKMQIFKQLANAKQIEQKKT